MIHIKVALDLEFTGLHKNTTLISLGAVSEYGDEFYGECSDFDKDQLDDWLNSNVIPHTQYIKDKDCNEFKSETTGDKNNKIYTVFSTTNYVGDYFIDWLKEISKIEGTDQTMTVQFILDCGAYDYILIFDLLKDDKNWPDFVDYIALDLCTLLYCVGVDPDVNREKFLGEKVENYVSQHNALSDAKVILQCFNKILPKLGKVYEQ